MTEDEHKKASQDILRTFMAMNTAQREDTMYFLSRNFCSECGSKYLPCYCRHDE